MSGNRSYIELMIICPASGCGYFIGDQDFDTDQLRCTTKMGSCAFLVISSHGSDGSRGSSHGGSDRGSDDGDSDRGNDGSHGENGSA